MSVGATYVIFDGDKDRYAYAFSYVVHVAFKRAIIKYAIENFPEEFAARDRRLTSPRHYGGDVYRRVGLE